MITVDLLDMIAKGGILAALDQSVEDIGAIKTYFSSGKKQEKTDVFLVYFDSCKVEIVPLKNNVGYELIDFYSFGRSCEITKTARFKITDNHRLRTHNREHALSVIMAHNIGDQFDLERDLDCETLYIDGVIQMTWTDNTLDCLSFSCQPRTIEKI